MKTSLDDLCNYYSGAADREMSEHVAEQLENPHSALSQLMAKANENAEHMRQSHQVPFRVALYFSPIGRLLLRRHSVVALVILVVTVGAGWAILRPRPDFSDSFSDNWLNPEKWKQNVRPLVHVENGYARLQDRGYLVTRNEYRHPIEVTLDWRWIDHEGDPEYTDDLVVALRTSGIAREDRPWEATDGLIIRFSSGPGFVNVVRATPTGSSPHIASSRPRRYALAANTWHRIRIVDTGRTIEVYVNGRSYWNEHNMDASHRDEREAILVAPYTDNFSAGHIAIYNREYVASVSHESHIDNVRIYRLAE